MSIFKNSSKSEISDVLCNISLVQKMKLLFLQDVVINGNDITIKRIVNEKKLIKILEDYRHHYDDVMKHYGTITIYNLEEDSLLRAGLEKKVLRFMIPYFNGDSGEFGKIVCKNKEYIYNSDYWICVDIE